MLLHTSQIIGMVNYARSLQSILENANNQSTNKFIIGIKRKNEGERVRVNCPV